MYNILLAGWLMLVGLTAAAAEGTPQGILKDWLGCQAQKCHFECLVEGRWIHLGNTGKETTEGVALRVEQTDTGLLEVFLANQGDPLHYLISVEQTFCRFQQMP